MKLNVSVLVLLASLGGEAAAQQPEFAAGRDCYMEGKFKKAAAHFRLALKTNPDDAESYYWMGMSYQMLADIAAPLDGKYNAKARACLTRAVELAPGRPEYRRELFDFLLDASAEPRLAKLLLAVPRAAYRIAELPASAGSSRRDALPPLRAQR